MKLDDETSAALFVQSFAMNLATQVIVACEQARVKPSSRRIHEVLETLLPERGAGFDEVRDMVEDKLARFNAAVSRLRSKPSAR